jgi:hypothetical protein
MPLQQRYHKDPAMIFRKIGGESLLVPIFHNAADMDSIYVLNEVGSRIWELLDGETPVWEIRDIITQEFEVTPREAEKDLLDFLGQLQAIGGLKGSS